MLIFISVLPKKIAAGANRSKFNFNSLPLYGSIFYDVKCWKKWVKIFNSIIGTF